MTAILTHRNHAILDYVTVGAFGLAPLVLPLGPAGTALSLGLAGVHLALTLTTAFPGGVIRLVPLRWHGAIELVVAFALALVPSALGRVFTETDLWFLRAAAVTILVVWALGDYQDRSGDKQPRL